MTIHHTHSPILELARIRERVSALEEANRLLQRENLTLRKRYNVKDVVSICEPDTNANKVDLLEELLNDAFSQNRLFRSALRDMEEAMDTMEVRHELMDARLKRQDSKLVEAHQELRSLRTKLAERTVEKPMYQRGKTPPPPPKASPREATIMRLRQRLIAQRKSNPSLQNISATRSTVH